MSISTSILKLGWMPQRSAELISREIDEELDFHIECRKRELIEGGIAPELAADEANRQFGMRDKIRRECRAIKMGNFGWLLSGLCALILVSFLTIGWMAIILKISHQKNQLMMSDLHERNELLLAKLSALQPQDGLDLNGEVKDAKGQPVSGAKVLLIRKSWPGGSYQQSDHVEETDDKGKFQFPKLYSKENQNAFLVTILAEGHTMQSEYVLYKPSAKAKTFRFKLKPAIQKTLIVYGEDGEPLADEIVFPGTRTQGAKEHLMYDQSGEAAGFRTDSEGKVKMSVFAAKDRVQLKSESGREIDFVVDEQAEQKVGSSDAAGMDSGIRGMVADESGQPISDAKVLLIHKTWPGGQYQQTSEETASEKDGSFAFPDCNQADDQEAFLVTIIKDGLAFESQYVLKKPGKTAVPFEFQLTAADKKTFLLKNSTGKPAKNLSVALSYRKDSDSKEHLIYGMSLKSVSFATDTDGKVELNFFKAGDTAKLNVGGNEIEFKVSDDAEQTVDLKKKVTQH